MNNFKHPKKRIRIKNNTHYFKAGTSKVYNEFISPRTYYARNQKIEGYETRLYWEYKYCQEHDGQTFFYTLTYNDKNIPKYEGKNCFDYEDLRELFNGGFTKNLLRNYGTKVKYFVGAELGDGKGERGIENNPHYHILFFLRPTDIEKYRENYEKISTSQFKHLIRMYWQGFDQDEEWKDYREAKKGIAKEGDNDGLVTDFRACAYCAKYVTKDVGLIKHEEKIKQALKGRIKQWIFTAESSYRSFWKNVIVPKYNIPENCTTDLDKKVWKWSNSELYRRIKPKNWAMKIDDTPNDYGFSIVKALKLQKEFKEHCKELMENEINERINEYRNRYCNKCRISQGVGEYGIKEIDDYNDPRIPIITKNGTKNRPINLYYYRKIYTDVVKNANGNNMRILNERGIEYKKHQIRKQIDKLYHRTLANLGTLNEEMYLDMYSSKINTECFIPWEEVKYYLKNYDTQTNARKYAEYKLVYEGRFYQIDNLEHRNINIDRDYSEFINPTYGKVRYSDIATDLFIQKYSEGYMAYYTHEYFLHDNRYFALHDLLADYLFIQEDDIKQKKAEEIAETRRYHKRNKFNEYINQLNKKL